MRVDVLHECLVVGVLVVPLLARVPPEDVPQGYEENICLVQLGLLPVLVQQHLRPLPDIGGCDLLRGDISRTGDPPPWQPQEVKLTADLGVRSTGMGQGHIIAGVIIGIRERSSILSENCEGGGVLSF